jgi:hypothetical protein
MRFRRSDIPRPTFDEIVGLGLAIAYLVNSHL